MDFKLLIRVQTIDGDVDYYDCKRDLVVIHDRALTINIFEIQRKFYPEYRLADLQIIFVESASSDKEV